VHGFALFPSTHALIGFSLELVASPPARGPGTRERMVGKFHSQFLKNSAVTTPRGFCARRGSLVRSVRQPTSLLERTIKDPSRMPLHLFQPTVNSTLSQLRSATVVAHRKLEEQIDAVAGFADPTRRQDLIRRFASFQLPAEAALAPHLQAVPELDWARRRRAALFPPSIRTRSLPPFPSPTNLAEALGMLYVLEGSTLGGHVIIRNLRKAGSECASLAFLDPYGPETGRRWRDFIDVLERATSSERARIHACKGAVLAFDHATSVLCGARA